MSGGSSTVFESSKAEKKKDKDKEKGREKESGEPKDVGSRRKKGEEEAVVVAPSRKGKGDSARESSPSTQLVHAVLLMSDKRGRLCLRHAVLRRRGSWMSSGRGEVRQFEQGAGDR